MSEKPILCPICRYQILPSEDLGCSQCPLHKRCSMLCCPSCGYSILLPEQSTLAKFTSYLIDGLKNAKKRSKNEAT